MFFLIISFVGLLSCKKLVTVNSPGNELTSENIYSNDATAASVLTNIYASFNANTPLYAQSINAISLVCGLSADELTLFGGSANANISLGQYYTNSLTSGQSASEQNIWNDFYAKIYIVNIAIENLAVSKSLTPAVKQQLTGEAKFLRAFFYFYLVNLYGDVPLTTSSNYEINAVLACSSPDLVYQQIIADLRDAKNLLSNGYVSSDAMTTTTERVRPNKWAAKALLARTYLYSNQYDSAETEASGVIENSSLYGLSVDLNSTFLKNSQEAIWQLQPVNTGWNTEDARIFIIPSTGPTSNSSVTGFPVYLSSELIQSFEAFDLRRLHWTDSVIVNNQTFYYPFKYKSATLNAPVTEYLMVLRLAEQYLIRAEARVEKNNFSGALMDIDTIRSRAGLPNSTADDKPSLLNAILHERQTELFTEWGHRWLDIKRTGNVNSIMNVVAPLKGATWNSNWQLYPIPLYDITQDPNIIQNIGY